MTTQREGRREHVKFCLKERASEKGDHATGCRGMVHGSEGLCGVCGKPGHWEDNILYDDCHPYPADNCGGGGNPLFGAMESTSSGRSGPSGTRAVRPSRTQRWDASLLSRTTRADRRRAPMLGVSADPSLSGAFLCDDVKSTLPCLILHQLLQALRRHHHRL